PIRSVHGACMYPHQNFIIRHVRYWQIRAGAFPGILTIPGRLMFGVTRPRNKRLGSEFAGVVEAIGGSVEGFNVGDRVYGILPDGGATADYIAVSESAAITHIPETLDFAEAAALPFGGLCALIFLDDFAQVKRDQKVLIIGASGGVGVYAVQMAKALGAVVTAVAGPDNQTFVTELGADDVIDYKATDITKLGERFHVVFDTVGAVSPTEARSLLLKGGLFLPLNYGLREIGSAFLNMFRDRKIRIAVNGDKKEDLERLNALKEQGKLRPVIGSRFSLDQAREAHALVETRHKRGSVVLDLTR
ncbi:MAG: NAD(P)-dependent alcohol dehydrogenase, partial [Pseudomonadota bacterium]